jgi:hypothetical protein
LAEPVNINRQDCFKDNIQEDNKQTGALKRKATNIAKKCQLPDARKPSRAGSRENIDNMVW